MQGSSSYIKQQCQAYNKYKLGMKAQKQEFYQQKSFNKKYIRPFTVR